MGDRNIKMSYKICRRMECEQLFKRQPHRTFGLMSLTCPTDCEDRIIKTPKEK